MSKRETFNETFLKAARGEKADHTPVWYMRQAGRSQPEYRKLKEKYGLFEITHQPNFVRMSQDCRLSNTESMLQSFIKIS